MDVVVRPGHLLQTKHQRPGIPFPLRLKRPPANVPQDPHQRKLLRTPHSPPLNPQLSSPTTRPTGPRIGIPHRKPWILKRPRPLRPPARNRHIPQNSPQNPLHNLLGPHHNPHEPTPHTPTNPPRDHPRINPQPQRHRTLKNPSAPTENKSHLRHSHIKLTLSHGIPHRAHQGIAHIG
ncbi:hypothetical protein GCM10022254_27630 [Actinomadura meridiana]|uniref:Uncharacterized protein n=1 Tax=Actinomadura meridiana TaxID=559626 RepID=A0ABP8C0X6_9ACTN